MKLPLLSLLCEILILSAVVLVLTVTVNTLSPRCIPWMGQWDTSKGVVTAVPRAPAVSYAAEITSTSQAKDLYDSGSVLFVDARPADQFQEGHIKGAASLPVERFHEEIDAFLARHPKDWHLITYCSGRECEDSHHLADFLREEGYRQVSVFIDGYPAWEQENLPVDGKHSGITDERS